MLKVGEWSAVHAPHETVVVGPELKRSLDARYNTSVTYIPNGVEKRSHAAACRIESFGLGHHDFVLFLARLVPEKQAHVLIEAFRDGARVDGVKLVIAGASWHSEAYTAELHRLAGDDPDIIFTGEVDEETLEELYSNCAVFVLPSEVEGMSLALLDALAFGCCIVCSDVIANTEVVGDAGLVFTAGDTADLATTMSRLLTDSDLAERYRKAAADRAETRFAWDDVATQWAEVYDRVLTAPSRRVIRIPRRSNMHYQLDHDANPAARLEATIGRTSRDELNPTATGGPKETRRSTDQRNTAPQNGSQGRSRQRRGNSRAQSTW